jgi:hypothetical protein
MTCEEQLIDLGFVKSPDEFIMIPYRPLFVFHPVKGDAIEVTLKRGRIYHTQKKFEKFETFIEKFKRDYGRER